MVTVALYICKNERFLRRGCPGDGCSFKVIPGDNITRNNGFDPFFCFLKKAEVEQTHSSGLLFTVTVFELKTDVLL